jgi:hypothetical protein
MTTSNRNMFGSKTGIVGQIYKELTHTSSENLMAFDFIILHRHCAAKFCHWRQNKLWTLVLTVNYIQCYGLNHYQFQHFLDEVESEFDDVIYNLAVRWLSFICKLG